MRWRWCRLGREGRGSEAVRRRGKGGWEEGGVRLRRNGRGDGNGRRGRDGRGNGGGRGNRNVRGGRRRLRYRRLLRRLLPLHTRRLLLFLRCFLLGRRCQPERSRLLLLRAGRRRNEQERCAGALHW